MIFEQMHNVHQVEIQDSGIIRSLHDHNLVSFLVSRLLLLSNELLRVMKQELVRAVSIVVR